MGWPRVSIGDRIEPSFGERKAAGEATESHPGTTEGAKADQRNVGVLGTGGQVEALGWAEGVEDRRQNGPIDAKGDADGEGGLGIWHFGKT